MNSDLDLLKMLATDMGGTIICASGRAVGFRDTDNMFRKLVVHGDSVILEQVSGPERGKRAEVAKLSSLVATGRARRGTTES
jgi:hypothetical protein